MKQINTPVMKQFNNDFNLNCPVCSYPEDVIRKGLTFIDGNKPLDNIIDISFALCNLIMGCEEMDESVKNSYCCLYSYLEFQFELLLSVSK
jgi:hypothetical protein